MDIEEIDQEYHRIDRGWRTVSLRDKRIAAARLSILETELRPWCSESVEAADLLVAVRLLRGRIINTIETG